MSFFSSLFQSGTSFYGDPFGPLLDTVASFGWNLLPAYGLQTLEVPTIGGGHVAPAPIPVFGPIAAPTGVGEWSVEDTTYSFAAHDDDRYTDVGDPPFPVAGPFFPEVGTVSGVSVPLPVLRQVLSGPVAGGQPHVPAPTVWPDIVVEEHPEGDFPQGSIFAPGGVWGPIEAEQHALDTDQEEPVPLIEGWFGDILDVFQGQVPTKPLPYQTYTQPAQIAYASPTARPGGFPASSPSAAPVLDKYGRPCRRRRRRRLLTNSDLKDLAALKTITGNNDALKMAVIKAVR